jgi:4-diphosphocytidyl-2C-methyl-D-erythritol 2-phosphate synthase
MPTALRSYAKINLGLAIGALRDDGFHELRTVYQTIALHDVVKVEIGRGTGIEIRCKNPSVPDRRKQHLLSRCRPIYAQYWPAGKGDCHD